MSNPLVYIVDDDEVLNRVIEARFLKLGCEVGCFSKPDDFFKAFSEKRPKILLVDINLGDGLSGFDIIKKIRNDYKADLPIIVQSGDKDLKQVTHALEIGANDYLVKPPLRLDFEEMVTKYIRAELSDSGSMTFKNVGPAQQSAKLAFRVSIEEVNPAGFTLLSDHLIRKGASFYLSGSELKRITPGCEKVFVTVVGCAMKITETQKKFRIQLEVDGSQEQALKEIRGFLNSRFTQRMLD